MRVRVGTRVRSNYSDVWTVKQVDSNGLVELEGLDGVRFHIPVRHLKSHGRRITWLSRWFGKERKA